MRLDTPRIGPMTDAEMGPEQEALVAPMRGRGQDGGVVLNVFRTLVRWPELARSFMTYASYILDRKRSMDPRVREILILRTGFLCRSGYEWTQHVPIGQRAGLTDAEIAAIKVGPSDPSWSPLDRLWLQAADELHHDQFISTPTWTALRAQVDEKALLDGIFSVGQYTQVSMFLNTVGVPLDPGQTLDPDLDHRPK